MQGGVGPIGERGDDRANSFEAQHAAIIARTLQWADEAAGRHDYAEALRWVETVEGVGEPLPGEYEAKRQAWLAALDGHDGRSAPADRRDPEHDCST